MNKIIKATFLTLILLSSSDALSQGIELDGRVTVKKGFCEDNGLERVKANNFLEQEAELKLLQKAQSKCKNTEVVQLTNIFEQEEIQRSISNIEIIGCHGTVQKDLLATASSSFICKELDWSMPICCYGYCVGEPFCWPDD